MVGSRTWHAGQPCFDESSDPRPRLDALPEEEPALTCAVQEELLAVCQRLKQPLERTRRGLFGPRSPVASQHDPRLQPCAHCAQRSGPGYVESPGRSGADFFSPSRRPEREHQSLEVLLRLAAGETLLPRSHRVGSHHTSKKRRRSTPTASAVVSRCHCAPDTATSRGRV